MDTLFTINQYKVLKSLWMPALGAVLFYFLEWHFPHEYFHGISFMVVCYMLSATLVFSWEFLYMKQWNRAFFMIGFVLLATSTQLISKDYKTYFPQQYLIYVIILFARFFLQGKPFAYGRVFLQALLVLSLPVFSAGLDMIIQVKGLDYAHEPFMLFIASLLNGILFTYSLYVVLFLFENNARDPAFKNRFNSKIAVISKGEFAFLFALCYTVLIASGLNIIVFFTTQQVNFYGDLSLVTFYFILSFKCCYYLFAAPALLRNVLLCRMTTTDQMNRIYCVLAITPLVNLIPFFVLCESDETSDEATNAARYLEPRAPVLRIAIIILGIFSSLLGFAAFNNLLGIGGANTHMIVAFVMVGFLVQLVSYGLLYKRNTIIPILIFTTIEMIAAALTHLFYGIHDKEGVLLLMQITLMPMVYYMYSEIFHPRLRGKDARIAQEVEPFLQPVTYP